MLKLFGVLKRRDRLLIALCIALICAQVGLELRLPDYTRRIALLLQAQASVKEILRIGAKMLLCALGGLLASVSVALCVSRVATNFGAYLRAALFDRVQTFSPQEMSQFSTSSLITRSTNDITQVQMLIVMGLQVLIKAPITAAWAIAKIWNKHILWTFSTAAAVAILCLMLLFVLLAVMPRFRALQRLTDELNRLTRETLTGISTIRAYNAERAQAEKFAAANNRLTDAHLSTQRILSALMPTIALVMNGLTLAVNWLGAYLVEAAPLAMKPEIFANMVTFLSYAMQILISFMLLVVVFLLIPRASVSARRIGEVLRAKNVILDGIETASLHEGEVEFRNVTFRYPDAREPALKNISFCAKKGQTVAFIGATGSGKSTLVNLIPRFFDASEGEVLVGGRNVREYTLSALRSKLGYASQKAILFSGTVESNVDFGDNACENIAPALRIAQAEAFVSELPQGVKSHIAQGGANLSGGQKQRISIARAIARNAEILIFDDSFSALDYKTDRILRECLKNQTATKLIVAQRIGTIRDADTIVVLDEGELVGIGTHEALMASCEVYRQIAYSQLTKEELA